MATKKKTRMMLISDLETNLFVRDSLDQDHALMLAELYEAGIELPPIQVAKGKIVVDGRHRIEARQLALKKDIEVEDIDLVDETEIIAAAYRANVGGSLPPKRQDTEHTICLLLQRGQSQKSIAELLSVPPSLARRYVKEVQSRMSRAKLQRAASSVTDGGMTVAKAAETHGVDSAKLKEILSGRRRKKTWGVAEIKAQLSLSYKSNGLKTAAAVRKLIEKFEDGDVTARQVADMLDHVEKLQRKAARAIADWRKRFELKQSEKRNAA
ncbi:MAG: hypothetical protein KGZ30_02155 [Anaplasmataceae bacterium]|nr:hypothetical protein [Anaplasmataceae bacterium]